MVDATQPASRMARRALGLAVAEADRPRAHLGVGSLAQHTAEEEVAGLGRLVKADGVRGHIGGRHELLLSEIPKLRGTRESYSTVRLIGPRLI